MFYLHKLLVCDFSTIGTCSSAYARNGPFSTKGIDTPAINTLKKIPHKFKRASYINICHIISPMGSAGKSLIAQNYVDQKGIVSNKYSYPNEQSQAIIDSLSVSAASTFTAIPVALGRLE